MDNYELTHHGIKGMRWGKRKAIESVSGSNSQSQRKESFKKGAKVAGGIAVGVAVAAGTIALASALNKKGSTPVSNLASSPSTSAGRDFLDLSFGAASRATSSSSGSGLNLGTSSRSSSSSSYPSMSRGGPSMSTLNDIINGGPHVTYDSKTGRYGTS